MFWLEYVAVAEHIQKRTEVNVCYDTLCQKLPCCLLTCLIRGLTAGCRMAEGIYRAAKALLIVAHGQYHSDMPIKEARSPCITSVTWCTCLCQLEICANLRVVLYVKSYGFMCVNLLVL